MKDRHSVLHIAHYKVWNYVLASMNWTVWQNASFISLILCFVALVSLYNLVNRTNLVHNLFLVRFSISTCFGQLWAHQQEKQPCFCDTWYLLFHVDDCLVCRVEYRTVIHTEYTVPSVAKTQLFLLMMGTSSSSFTGVTTHCGF
jgi:hypothetical protein